MGRWIVGLEDSDSKVVRLPGSRAIVLDTLSEDSIPNLLCQSCYGYVVENNKVASKNTGVVMSGHDLSNEKMRQAKDVELAICSSTEEKTA